MGFRHRHDVVVMEFLSAVKTRFRNWREWRFLCKHGCITWDQYHKVYDPDHSGRATTLRDFYHGYPYWRVFDNRSHFCYDFIADYGPGGLIWGFHRMQAWCKDNTKHKFRMDGLRVSKFHNEWQVNEITGGDRIVFAFKDERDYVWFMLRWS